jgi:hypothetical protein
MSYQAITLHLTKLDTSKSLAVGDRLSSQWVNWTSVPEFYFVLRHVVQSLVECWPHKYE